MHFPTSRRQSRRVLLLAAASCATCLTLLACRAPTTGLQHRLKPFQSMPNIAAAVELPKVVRHEDVVAEVEPAEPEYYEGIPGLIIPHPRILPPQPRIGMAYGAFPPIYDPSEIEPLEAYQEIPLGSELLLTPDEYAIPEGRGPKPPLGPDKKPVKYPKYYQERSVHFDARWFKTKTPDSQRGPLIRKLFAAWSRFADERKVPYWIMHGSLLGWHFGGRQQPWDDDVDVQVNANMLYVLARYNMTFGSGADSRYILDVNPEHITRYHEHENVIDARFIDTENGHFIDITGVAFVEADDSVVQCKTPHKYRLDQIYPLTRTLFEGVPTWRPFAVAVLLEKEYRKGVLTNYAFNHYRFDRLVNKWLKEISPQPPLAQKLPFRTGTAASPPAVGVTVQVSKPSNEERKKHTADGAAAKPSGPHDPAKSESDKPKLEARARR